MSSQRAQFPLTVERLMAERDDIVVLLGDIGVQSFKPCAVRWPERVLNVGVCEQAMVGMAAGLAKGGYFPVVHTIASFLVRRAYEQIYVDLGINKLPALLVGVGAKGEYRALGPTHACPEDTTLMRCVPGMRIAMPTDAAEADRALTCAIQNRALTYVRLGA